MRRNCLAGRAPSLQISTQTSLHLPTTYRVRGIHLHLLQLSDCADTGLINPRASVLTDDLGWITEMCRERAEVLLPHTHLTFGVSRMA